MEKLEQAYERNRKMLLFAIFAAFIWGMTAHGYAFFDNSVSHDSMQEFHAEIFGNNVRIGAGRILSPVYRMLFRGDITLTWLIGVLSLLYLGITTFFVARIFQVQSKWMVFLIAGILTTNITVSATAATYIHDLDCYMFAVMCAAGAVFLRRRYHWGWLAGAVLVAITLGIYQANLFVAVALAMMACIWDLLDGHRFREVFVHGCKAIGMILIGGVVYYVLLQIVLKVMGTALATEEYNSPDQVLSLPLERLPELIAGAYRHFMASFWRVRSGHPKFLVRLAVALLALLGMTALGISLKEKRMGRWERILCIVLVLLLPLGMNMIYVLASGIVHHLMLFATWLAFVLILLLCDRLAKQKQGRFAMGQRLLCMVLTGVLVYGSAMFANGLYMKKDLEFDAYMSLMTRVLDRIETYDGYEGGETPVVFVGLPEKDSVLYTVTPGFWDYTDVTGADNSDVLVFRVENRYQMYFSYFMGAPIRFAEEWIWYTVNQSDFAEQMPSFPDRDCVTMIDGVMIVKLGPALKYE